MEMKTVFSSATALLSSEFIANYTRSDLDVLLARLGRTIGIEIIIKNETSFGGKWTNETISIGGKWTSLIEAHGILLSHFKNKDRTTSDCKVIEFDEQHELIKETPTNEAACCLADTGADETSESNVLQFVSEPEKRFAIQVDHNYYRQTPNLCINEDVTITSQANLKNVLTEPYMKRKDCTVKAVERFKCLEKPQKVKDIIFTDLFEDSNKCEEENTIYIDIDDGGKLFVNDIISQEMRKQNCEFGEDLNEQKDQGISQQLETDRSATMVTVLEPVASQSSRKKSDPDASSSISNDIIGQDLIAINSDEKYEAHFTGNRDTERHSSIGLKTIQTTKTETFPCVECKYVGKSDSLFGQHRARQHGVKLKCDQCDTCFVYSKDLNRHKNTVHDPLRVHKRNRWKTIQSADGTFPCYECDYIGKSKTHIRDHTVRSHNLRFKCDHCEKFFGQLTDMKRHKRCVHGAARSCEDCGKSYKTKTSYERHLKSHQEDGLSHLFTCDTCNKRLSTVHSLASHIETEHLGIQGHILCQICGKIFRRKQHYLQHMNSHAGLKLYQCDICKKRFSRKQGYREHIEIHTDTIHVCSICDKTFASTKSLSDHKRYNHRPSVQCANTNKKISSLKLGTHLKTHSGFRDYICNICGKSFTQSSSLLRHERVHSDDQPYKCSVCNKASHDPSVLRRHVILVHRTDPDKWQEAVVSNFRKKNDTYYLKQPKFLE